MRINVTPDEFNQLDHAADQATRTLDGSTDEALWFHSVGKVLGLTKSEIDSLCSTGPHQIFVCWDGVIHQRLELLTASSPS